MLDEIYEGVGAVERYCECVEKNYYDNDHWRSDDAPNCDKCHNTGIVPTEFGQAILNMMNRNRPKLTQKEFYENLRTDA